ncbi:TFIIB-type zinc ribbon-containing protein [Pedobacter antarcticus]|nr:zf-TFIIB domain-containing protein [Pedobacter antarcticus]
MTDRQGIEIDYCPKCRGVWLDKGELDKIIEKSLEQETPVQNQQTPNQQNPNYNNPYNPGGYSDGGHHGSYNKHGRRGFLGNLFDF